MTQYEYIDFIRNSLSMVDKTAKFLRPQVEAALNFAINTVFYEVYLADPKKFRKSMERYTVRGSLAPILTGLGVRGRYTAPIASDIVDLPRKTGGIIEIMQLNDDGIAGIENTTTTYVPVTTMEGEQFYGSEASLPGNVVGFSWSGAKEVEFWGMSVAEAAKGVSARYIKQFNEYASTDDVILPYGQDNRIVELVREYLGVIPPKDTINDNVDPYGKR